MSRQDRWSWFSALQQQTRRWKSVSHAPGRGFARSRRLHVETLEDRRLLAVFSVSNLDDAGTGSLRDAITLANANGEADTIDFSSIDFSVPGTIDLASQLPTITEGLTIVGPGQELLTIDAGNGLDGEFATGDGWRIFEVNDSAATLIDVSISGLTLTGGDTARGMDDSQFSQGVSGGAIASFENFELLHSTVTGNATGDGGNSSSPFGIGGSGGLRGGILAAYGEIRIVFSTITNNERGTGGTANILGDGGRGGGIVTLGGQVSIEDSIVTGNRTNGKNASGGGISSNFGEVTVLRSSISSNLTNGNFSSGGGIANRFGNILIDSSAIYGNSTLGDGSGGGGFYNRRSADDQVAEIRDTTISGNSVANDEGGGVLIFSGIINIVRSTITSNSAPVDGGSGLFSLSNSVATVNFYNSIVAGNTNEDLAASSFSHPFESLGYNLIGTSKTPEFFFLENFVQPGDVTGVTNLLLGPLADNGGPTATHALLPGSPAIDMGDPSVLSDPTEFDQRGSGFARVANGRIDIGAFELQNVPSTNSADFDTDGDIDGADFLAWQRGFGTIAPNATAADGDANGDQAVDAADLVVWEDQFGQPAAVAAMSAPLASEPVVEASLSTNLLPANFIDAAFATVWLDSTADEEETVFLAGDESALEVVFAGVDPIASLLPKPVTKSSFADSETASTQEDEAIDEPWLADEVLEQVFG